MAHNLGGLGPACKHAFPTLIFIERKLHIRCCSKASGRRDRYEPTLPGYTFLSQRTENYPQNCRGRGQPHPIHPWTACSTENSAGKDYTVPRPTIVCSTLNAGERWIGMEGGRERWEDAGGGGREPQDRETQMPNTEEITCHNYTGGLAWRLSTLRISSLLWRRRNTH